MQETASHEPGFINFVQVIARLFPDSFITRHLEMTEGVIFSGIVVIILAVVFYLGQKKLRSVPGRLQNALEMLISGIDGLVCSIIGKKGRKHVPFVGTLFVYIITMNLLEFVPFMRPMTSSLSTTAALSLCVFIYVQFWSFKEHGFFGYMDELAGKPRGFIAFSVVFPLFMFFLHVLTEFIRPVTLALRLRSNIWGDEILLAIVSGFGIIGLPLMLFSTLIAMIGAIVQALVFTLLTTVYLALIYSHEEDEAHLKEV